MPQPVVMHAQAVPPALDLDALEAMVRAVVAAETQKALAAFQPRQQQQQQPAVVPMAPLPLRTAATATQATAAGSASRPALGAGTQTEAATADAAEGPARGGVPRGLALDAATSAAVDAVLQRPRGAPSAARLAAEAVLATWQPLADVAAARTTPAAHRGHAPIVADDVSSGGSGWETPLSSGYSSAGALPQRLRSPATQGGTPSGSSDGGTPLSDGPARSGAPSPPSVASGDAVSPPQEGYASAVSSETARRVPTPTSTASSSSFGDVASPAPYQASPALAEASSGSRASQHRLLRDWQMLLPGLPHATPPPDAASPAHSSGEEGGGSAPPGSASSWREWRSRRVELRRSQAAATRERVDAAAAAAADAPPSPSASSATSSSAGSTPGADEVLRAVVQRISASLAALDG